jgi:hypothetical protein
VTPAAVSPAPDLAPRDAWVEALEAAGASLVMALPLGVLGALHAAQPDGWSAIDWRTGVACWGGSAAWLGVVAAGWRISRGEAGARLALATALVAVGPLALLGAAIKTFTNHRPLGAAVFAVSCCAVLLVAAPFVARGAKLARDRAAPLRWSPFVASLAIALALLLNAPRGEWSALLIAVTLAVAIPSAIAAARRRRFPPALRMGAAASWVVVVVASAVTVRFVAHTPVPGYALGVWALVEPVGASPDRTPP